MVNSSGAVSERRRPGSRGRIGVIQPAPGVMLEHEWPRYLPEDVLFPVARVRLPSADLAGYDAVANAAPEAARDLAGAGADLIAYACTIGSLYAGADAETALIAQIQSASGKPVLALAETCVAAMRGLGVARPLLVTPYDDVTNGLVIAYAERQGLAVTATAATPVGIVTVGDIQPPEIAALCISALRNAGEADGLWLPCTAMQTLEAIPFIEAVTGMPVVSGSQALLWRALAMLGAGPPSRPAGQLFQTGERR